MFIFDVFIALWVIGQVLAFINIVTGSFALKTVYFWSEMYYNQTVYFFRFVHLVMCNG